MTMDPSKKEMGSKKEDEGDEIKSKLMTASSSSSSRQWSSSLKNPRIVRVSRGYGGKDRHSKVCTVRGLRDRRIRLSVPTAIQLYDLQDRLGLSQPSKVIDWLIDATQHEIDKLPPLPMLPSDFLHYFHQPSADHSSIVDNPHGQPPSYAADHPHLSASLYERERWSSNSTTIGSSQNGGEGGGGGGFGGFVAQLSAHNFFPLNSQFSVPNMPYSSNYFQLDTAPNLSLSQFGGGFAFSDRADEEQQQPSSQIFPPYVAAPSLESDQFSRQINHLQNSMLLPATLHLINPPIKSLSLNPSLHSDQNETGEQDERRRTS